MMLTRSQSASTSERMWLESSTVRPARAAPPRCTCAEGLLHQRVEAATSARRAAAARRPRRARPPGRPSAGCPWSSRGPSCAGRGRSARAARPAACSSSPPRNRPEQVDHLAAGEVRPQRDVARHVRQPPVQRDRVAPGVAAEQPDVAARRRGAARAGPASWWSCRRRSARGSRAPPRRRRRGRARRAPGPRRRS